VAPSHCGTGKEENEVDRIGRFLRDGRGAITVGSIVVGIGILSISALVAMALSTDLPVSSTADSGAVVSPIAGGKLQLTRAVALPVGAVVVHSAGSFTSFRLPDGGWLDSWSHGGNAIPMGSVLTSPQTFTTKGGGALDAEIFASSIAEAYSSHVKYVFK